MDAPPFKKRPRLESEPENAETDSGDTEEQTVSDGEEDLVALIEHRSKEVEHLRKRFSYYKSQVFFFNICKLQCICFCCYFVIF